MFQKLPLDWNYMSLMSYKSVVIFFFKKTIKAALPVISLFIGRLLGQEALVRPILTGEISCSPLYTSKILPDTFKGKNVEKSN